jgi:hypothetical protein
VVVIEALTDEIDEVGRLEIERAGGHLHRIVDGPVGGVGGDVTGVGHCPQHYVAAILGPVDVGEGRVIARRLDHPGDERAFAQAEVAEVLGVEDAGRLGHAVQRERAAMPEINLVEIQLENFFLRGLHFQHHGHELLEQLAANRALAGLRLEGHFIGEEEVAGELLGDGASADQIRPRTAQVGHQRADDADRVDARVGIEAAILDRQHCLLDVGGND